MRENSQRLVASQTLHPRLRGDDEIAHLDYVFHSMAAALSEAARKERALFDNAQDVICAIDENDLFTKLNPAAALVFGVDANELTGASVYTLFPPEEHDSVRKQFAEARWKEDCQLFEMPILRADGHRAETSWSVFYSKPEKSLFCVAHDITKRKALERLKEEFMAMVSHDMRTPLSAIFASLQLIAAGRMGELPPLVMDRIHAATRNSKRLINLINDLLDFEKLEAGEMVMDLKEVSLDEVFATSISSIEDFASPRRVTVTAEKTGLRLMMDEERILQVLLNLLSNAIKFSPPESVVRLSAEVVANPQFGAHGFVEISVTDCGRGVPEHLHETIFERYKQVQAADGKRQTGTGLGLPICRRIVNAHGGTIGIENRIEGGSRFWFRLNQPSPLRQASNEGESESSSEVRSQSELLESAHG